MCEAQFVCARALNGPKPGSVNGQMVAGGLEAARRRVRKRSSNGCGSRKRPAGSNPEAVRLASQNASQIESPEDRKPQGGKSDGASSVAEAERRKAAEQNSKRGSRKAETLERDPRERGRAHGIVKVRYLTVQWSAQRAGRSGRKARLQRSSDARLN